MADKIQIDPAHPVGSLTAGAQQFTVVGDTNHKKQSIHATLNDDIPVMAANGVKKIMIEYDVIAFKDLEKKYPDLAGARTAEDRAAVLEAIKAKHDAVISAETDRETAGLKMFGTPQEREEWSKAFGKGYERAVGIIGQSNIDELRRAQDSLATHAFLEKVYSKPPGLTDDEIRKESQYYVSSHAETAADKKASADNFANLLIRSRDNGIRVVFSGDHDSETSAALTQAELTLQRFRNANPAMEAIAEQRAKDPSFEIPRKDVIAFSEYSQQEIKYIRAVTAAMVASNATRTDEGREALRAERMIELAGGEKSVVIWGAGHSNKPNDFNEMIDARLQAQAAKTGAPPPPATRVIELYDSKAEYESRRTEGRVGVDEPDVRHYIQERESEITPSGAAQLQLKSGPTVGQTPGAAEYAALMERLTGGSSPSAAPSLPAPPAPPERQVALLAQKPAFTP